MNDGSGPAGPDGPDVTDRFAHVALASLPTPVFVADENGTFVWACENTPYVFGRTASEMIREESVESLFGERFVPRRFEAFEGGELRVNVTDDAGESHDLLLTVTALADDPTLFVYAGQDVTALVKRERALDEVEHRFRGVFDGTLDSLVLADDDGVYREVNPAACELFGVPEEELVGRSIADFTASEFDFDAAWSAFLEVGEQRGEFPLLRPDGDVRIVDFAAVANIREGEHLSVLRDVTDRVRRQQVVREQRDELLRLADLSDLVRRVNRQLVGATERDEIFEVVCESFVDADRYDVAALFSVDPVAVAVAAGVAAETLEASATVTAAVERARDSGDLIAVDAGDEALLDEDSLSALPVTYDGVVYGVFVVGGSGVSFDDNEQALLRELAQTVGKALATTAAKRLLHAKSVLRLEFVVEDETHIYNRLTLALDAHLNVDEIVPVADHREVHYVTLDTDDTADVLAVAESLDGVVSCRILSEDGETTTAEFVVDGGTPALTLVEQGASVVEVVCDRRQCRIVADVAPRTDVRTLVSHIEESFPGTRLVRKQTRPPSATPPVDDPPDTELTAKQRRALRAAFTAGYYGWPQRRTTAAELSESFGVSPATFHQHLRVAEAKVITEYFLR